MLDLETYRLRIGIFNLTTKNRLQKSSKSSTKISKVFWTVSQFMRVLLLTVCVFIAISFYQPERENKNSISPISLILPSSDTYKISINPQPCVESLWSLLSCLDWSSWFQDEIFITLSRKSTSNFKARYLHGNIGRGVKNVHINVRSLYNKVGEVQNFINQEKPHIIGVSEAELLRAHHSEGALKIPGYDILLPKSWDESGTARILVYVKKGIIYQQLSDLEDCGVQSIWLRAGFKNCKPVYYCHVYREHTNYLGSSMASQRKVLDKMLGQWEEALKYGDINSTNEVHVAGDMNLDCYKGRWLDSNYSLASLARMVIDTCDANNFHQLVKGITRAQFNSVTNKTNISCIDHLYCNAKHRISPVKILSWGSSDHDAISYVRFSKEPKPPSRTLRKRSYKNFCQENFIRDVSNIDFSEVYRSLDVDLAADLLSQKLVEVLNLHAPWIIFQQRKHYLPWITKETVQLMQERDQYKREAKSLSLLETEAASPEQIDLWKKYKKLRNKINSKIKQEERVYKQAKASECQESITKTWNLAKNFMEWTTAGPPTQLEIEEAGKINLVSKADLIANLMNEYFINKVQLIVQGLRDLPLDLSGCIRIMRGKKTSLTFSYISVGTVRKLLKSLKGKKSTSVDQLDSFAVKIAAEYIAGPLHHVIVLSLMQQKFPTVWKYTKIVPLHKKKSALLMENYRPVAIISPLSKILEKVVYRQIYQYFESNKIFHDSLHGYRRNRSTLTALLTMYDKWARAASMGQVTGVLFVDLSSAFDLVPYELLVKKLKIYGLKEDIINWTCSYLTQRYQMVWIDHTFSDCLESNTGVPQGSILGPLLFIIYFNDLPMFLAESIDCYADDSTVGASDIEIEDVGKRLTADCGNLVKWMNENKFRLNAEKTHLMVLGSSARLQRVLEPAVIMNGVTLSQSKNKRETLLGVEIQSNLKWSAQVEALSLKLKTKLAGLEKLRFIFKKQHMKGIVQGIFNSVLCYCLPLFGGCSKLELDKLQTLQNRAVRLSLNLPPRSNRDKMYNMIGWLTVRQLIAYHTLLVIHKIRVNNQPSYLSQFLLRENHNGHIIIKNVHLNILRDSFVFRGAVQWNNLPRSLRSESSASKFKKSLKTWVLDHVSRFGV